MIILINLWPNLPCENISGMLENVGYFDLPPHTPFDFGDPSSQIGFLVVSDDFKKKSFNIKKFGLGFFSCHFWRRTVWACTWRHFRFQGMNLSVWSLPDKQCYCFACEIGYGGGDVSFAKRSSGGKTVNTPGDYARTRSKIRFHTIYIVIVRYTVFYLENSLEIRENLGIS